MALVTLAVFVEAFLAIPSGASSPSLLRVVTYAANTANHASPARIVTDADVLNAFDTPSLNPPLSTGVLSVIANLGDLPGASRDILVENPSTYSQICVNFPAMIGASPLIVTCPTLAFARWEYEPRALDVSRDAIAAAALKGRSVSGSDVVKAARDSNVHLKMPPTFPAGRGGIVTFRVNPTADSEVTSDYLCVKMPHERFGIPRVVPCSR